jgi:nucleotide-binding universal stress UspA family protein
MYHRILMPVDLTDRHEAALKRVAELCRQSQGEVVLLHVVELIQGLGVEEERLFYDRLERVARQHLQQLARQLEQMGVRCRVDVRLGARLGEVVQQVKETGADLVVFTSPRPNADNPLAGWASLSYRVALLVPCSVLMVR